MNERLDLLELADKHHGNDRAYLINIVINGTEDQVEGAIYEIEAKQGGMNVIAE